jgi:hypothetical protein
MARHRTPVSLEAIRDLVAEAEAASDNPEWRHALTIAATSTLEVWIEAVATGQHLPPTVESNSLASTNPRARLPRA